MDLKIKKQRVRERNRVKNMDLCNIPIKRTKTYSKQASSSKVGDNVYINETIKIMITIYVSSPLKSNVCYVMKNNRNMENVFKRLPI